jgi:hypothetical protein
MTTIHDTIKALLERRQACVTEVASIDRELADVKSTVTDAITQLAPLTSTSPAPEVPAPTTAAEPAAARARPPPASTISRSGARPHRPFEREIKTALVKGPLAARHRPGHAARSTRTQAVAEAALAAANRVAKIGVRGPSVKWEIANTAGAGARLRASETASTMSGEFETVFPKPGNPKASPREAIEGART